jgi:hypothetical protein
MAIWTKAQAAKFAEAAQSLKLYRRAELFKTGTNQSIIEQLYVDPLPNDAILQGMVRANTTFITGRKGTGKSTVFQRAQFDIRKRRDAISAYVDIKTVYESAEVDGNLLEKIAGNAVALSQDEAQRLLLYKAFIQAVFRDIKKELKRQLEASWSAQLWEGFTGKRQDILESINEIIEDAFEGEITDLTALASDDVKTRASVKQGRTTTESTAASAKMGTSGPGASINIKASDSWSNMTESGSEHAFARVLMRTFNLNSVIQRLEDVLHRIGVRHLFIFVDDFSELPLEAMTVFVDSILAPLNNWSNELIKFKIAAYPGRIYYGKLDKTKIDEFHLDLYRLYGANDVTTMEEKAVDFTRRLIHHRLDHFCKCNVDVFFDGNPDVYRQLFYATSGNPRNLGHLLSYLHESQIAYGKPIGVRAINDAAVKYYEEKIEPFFGVQKFRHETFAERASTYSLKELLESIIERSRELRTYKGNAILRELPGRPQTSHFYVVSELESLLSTLELNFFLTKYFEMKDKDGRSVSLFALNYGLCAKYQISFGRPEGKRQYRYYFAERVFDNTTILRRYLQVNQEIKCTGCDEVFGLEMLPSIQLFGMLCPSCKSGECQVNNLSKKYETMLTKISPELLLPETELGILETLFVENDIGASEIAGELDCSYQLVGKRGKIMEDRGLLHRRMFDNRRRFRLTAQAVRDYFDDNDDRRLTIATEEDA